MKIGMMELVVVFAVALFLLGPDKLPIYARKLGQALGEFKRCSSELTKDIRESVVEPLEEAQAPLRAAAAPLEEVQKSIQENVKEVKTSFESIGKTHSQEKEAEKETPVEKAPEQELEAQKTAGCIEKE